MSVAPPISSNIFFRFMLSTCTVIINGSSQGRWIPSRSSFEKKIASHSLHYFPGGLFVDTFLRISTVHVHIRVSRNQAPSDRVHSIRGFWCWLVNLIFYASHFRGLVRPWLVDKLVELILADQVLNFLLYVVVEVYFMLILSVKVTVAVPILHHAREQFFRSPEIQRVLDCFQDRRPRNVKKGVYLLWLR